MPIKIEMSERLSKLPPYLFAEIDRLKREARLQGKDIIDLGAFYSSWFSVISSNNSGNVGIRNEKCPRSLKRTTLASKSFA